jgi:ATP-binding protein involved in chromosome partitioning
MFRQVRVEILGIVENMSYFQCSKCDQRTEIFSHGGAEETARKYEVPFLGEVPLDISIRLGGDSGKPIVVAGPDSTAGRAFEQIARNMAAQVSIANLSSTAEMIIQ